MDEWIIRPCAMHQTGLVSRMTKDLPLCPVDDREYSERDGHQESVI